MKLFYLTNSRLPGEKAHAIQIMKTCSALSAKSDLLLIHANRKHRDWLKDVTDLQAYYALQNPVARKTLPSLDIFDAVLWLPQRFRGFGYKLVFALQLITYHLSLITYLLFNRADVYYTRDSTTAAVLALLLPRQRAKIFFEAHSFPSSGFGLRLQRWLTTRIGGISVLTSFLKAKYRDLGATEQQLAIIADAVDLAQFSQVDMTTARQALSLSPDQQHIVYVGQFYVWKGVDTLIAAAKLLPESVQVHLVGGTPEETPRIKALIAQQGVTNIALVGRVAPTQVQTWMAAADVLVLPNSGKQAVSMYYTSPLKLFEYLAVGGAIVASDLPSIGEVLTHEETALLVAPDDAAALANGITRLCEETHLAQQLRQQAKTLALRYTWDARADQILDFVLSK